MALIRKDKEKFRSARKIPPSGKRPLYQNVQCRKHAMRKKPAMDDGLTRCLHANVRHAGNLAVFP